MSTIQALNELLRHLRRFDDEESNHRRLVEWLQRRIDVDIALVDGEGGTQLSTGGLTEDVLASLRPVLAQVSSGRLAAAAVQVGAEQVRCEALGRHVPRPVLVVAGAPPLTPEAIELASHTGTVLEALRRIGAAGDLAHRHRQSAHRLRTAVYMALMAGEPTLARRMTAGAVPPLLDAERLRILLLRCPPADRARLAETYEDASGYHGRGLMVRCPVYDHHLICLAAEDEGGGDGLEPLLLSLVRDNPGYALGISEPHPLDATSAAYDQARHALAVARQTRGRVSAYHGFAPLARVLAQEEAVPWAQDALRPLGSAPRLTHEVLRLALNFPRSGVARLLGISRNTVTAHLRRAESALGADLQDARDRARFALALAIAAPRPHGGAGPDHPPAHSYESLLSTEAAVAWARTFLKPLDGDEHRTVHRTLRAWIEADVDAQRTARRLGISRTTVRARLRTAEELLNRDLRPPNPGTHDLVHALYIDDRARDHLRLHVRLDHPADARHRERS